MNSLNEFFFGTAPIAWIQEIFGPGHPLPFRILSLLGDTWGVLLVIGVAFWVFGRRTFHAVGAMVVFGAITKLGLTRLFSMPRPSGPDITVHADLDIGSFPSGHVYEAVGPWGLLYAMGCVPLWVPAVVALLVGLGRFYLGAHYLGDVVGGVVFAVGAVWIFRWGWPLAMHWLARRGPAFYRLLWLVVVAATLVAVATIGGNPRRFEIYGMLLGASLAVPVERRWVGYDRGTGSAAAAAGKVLLGFCGLTAFLLWDRSQPDRALLLGTWTAGLATLWVIAGAPWIFRRVGVGGAARRYPDSAPGLATDSRTPAEEAGSG